MGKDFSMNRGTISLISTLSFIIYGISQPIIGRLVDKLGPRMILSVSTFVVGISFILTSFVNHPWQLFILYGIVISVGVGGASNVAATVVVTNWFNENADLLLELWRQGLAWVRCFLFPALSF